MLNELIIAGRVVEDPELRSTKNGIAVSSFRIAVRRDYVKKGDGDDTDFFDVVAWRSTAEFVCKYFRKGSLAQVVGRIENRKWTDKHEQPRVTTEIIADKVYFGDSKGKDESAEVFDPFDTGTASTGHGAPPEFDPFR